MLITGFVKTIECQIEKYRISDCQKNIDKKYRSIIGLFMMSRLLILIRQLAEEPASCKRKPCKDRWFITSLRNLTSPKKRIKIKTIVRFACINIFYEFNMACYNQTGRLDLLSETKFLLTDGHGGKATWIRKNMR